MHRTLYIVFQIAVVCSRELVQSSNDVSAGTLHLDRTAGEQSVDPLFAPNTLMSSSRHWGPVRFWSALSLVHLTSHRTEHHAMGQSLISRPLHGSRKEEASIADSRITVLTFCVLESLGVPHAVVGVLSALKANDP